MVRKIAVLRANALGDFIFVLPALQALHETFRDAEIVLLGRQWHKEYLTGRPGPVDRVVVVPLYPGISEREGYVPDEKILSAFFNEMQEEDFDIAFQMHGGGKNSNPFLLKLGAKQTIGLQTPDAASLDSNVPYVYYFNETLRYLEVVGRAGAKTKNIEPHIVVTEKDIAEAEDVLQNLRNKRLAVIHPGASDIRRRWPAAKFAQITDFLVEQDYNVCITGLAWEREIIDEVLTNVTYKNKVHDLSARLSLNGTTGLLSLSDIIISNDTGPLHLARALKKPSVGIYLFENIINASPITTSINRNLLSWTMNCPLCGLSSKLFNSTKNACNHKTSFIDEVTVEEVKDAIKDLMLVTQNKLVNAQANR